MSRLRHLLTIDDIHLTNKGSLELLVFCVLRDPRALYVIRSSQKLLKLVTLHPTLIKLILI